jgi:DNA-binding NtrC family response regulator
MVRASAHKPSVDPAPAARAGAVLIVTDDYALTRVYTATLEQAGYDVVSATHSGHALLLGLRGYRPDVLLTDLCMPDGSGPALAGRLRRYDPQMRAIYFANPGTLLNENNVLVRPFSRDDLLSRLRKSFTASQAS